MRNIDVRGLTFESKLQSGVGVTEAGGRRLRLLGTIRMEAVGSFDVLFSCVPEGTESRSLNTV